MADFGDGGGGGRGWSVLRGTGNFRFMFSCIYYVLNGWLFRDEIVRCSEMDILLLLLLSLARRSGKQNVCALYHTFD